MLLLAKDNSDTPESFSTGDDSNPVVVSFSLTGDGIPATVTKIPDIDIFVWANNHTGTIANYSEPKLDIVGEDIGITWELSTDGETWGPSISLATLDVSETFKAVQVFARATAVNDGTVETDNYTTAKVTIMAPENPA